MNVKLPTEHHLGFLSLKRGCTGSSETTLVKMAHCWKSHVTAQILCNVGCLFQIRQDHLDAHDRHVYCECQCFIRLVVLHVRASHKSTECDLMHMCLSINTVIVKT